MKIGRAYYNEYDSVQLNVTESLSGHVGTHGVQIFVRKHLHSNTIAYTFCL
jgi:hypothetical protein